MYVKSEYRISKSETISNVQNSNVSNRAGLGHWNIRKLGFVSNFVLRISKLAICFLALIAALLAATGAARAATYYVSTAGSDTNAGTEQLPWKTIQQAANVMQAGDTVIVAGGMYREGITPKNSGSSGMYISYKARNGENVIIAGSDVVTGWSVDQGYIYKANVAVEPDAVFEDGKPLMKARTPNGDVNDVWRLFRGASFTAQPGSDATHIVDSELANAYPDYVGAMARIRHSNWIWNQIKVTAYDSNTHTLTLGQNVTNLSSGHCYFLEGLRDFLDAPGEWVWQNGVLYVMTTGKDDPSRHSIEASSRNNAFYLRDKSYIVIDGFEIKHTKQVNWYHGAIYYYSPQDTGNIIIQNTSIHDCGDNGIYLAGTWDAGTTYPSNFTVRNSTISRTGGHGIMIRAEVDNGLIENNTIEWVGIDGIFIAQGGTGIARHWVVKDNYIHDSWQKGPFIVDGQDIMIEHNFFASGQNRFNIGVNVNPLPANPVPKKDITLSLQKIIASHLIFIIRLKARRISF